MGSTAGARFEVGRIEEVTQSAGSQDTASSHRLLVIQRKQLFVFADASVSALKFKAVLKFKSRRTESNPFPLTYNFRPGGMALPKQPECRIPCKTINDSYHACIVRRRQARQASSHAFYRLVKIRDLRVAGKIVWLYKPDTEVWISFVRFRSFYDTKGGKAS